MQQQRPHTTQSNNCSAYRTMEAKQPNEQPTSSQETRIKGQFVIYLYEKEKSSKTYSSSSSTVVG